MKIRNGHSPNGHDGIYRNGNGRRNGARSSLPLDWEHLARATAHPLRISILEILGQDGGRTLSPSDLSQELQIPLSNTNYHVTELAKAGLIELTGQRQVRGATEHFYRIPEASSRARSEAETATGSVPVPGVSPVCTT
jgi:DNA-binding transcriptional ArsR family regulator